MTTTMPQAMGAAPLVQRYSPIQVILHWLIAALVLITPLLASEGEGRGQPAIAGLPVIGWHMIFGISILVLLVIRLLIRLLNRHPDWATTGNALLDRIGQWTHAALYFFTFAVTVTGLIFAIQTNRLAATFGGAPREFAPGIGQPGTFQPPAGARPEGGEQRGGFGGGIRAVGRFVFRAFHELSWKILLALIILHVAAALYHQFIRRDHLLGRMWFGNSA
jgi:cytochrome b561